MMGVNQELATTYEELISKEVLLLRVKHLVLLLLYGACRRAWNFVARRLELSLTPVRTKKLIREIVRTILIKTGNGLDYASLDGAINGAINQLLSEELIRVSIEESPLTYTYIISPKGISYFEDLLPLLPPYYHRILKAVRDNRQALINGNVALVLRVLDRNFKDERMVKI